MEKAGGSVGEGGTPLGEEGAPRCPVLLLACAAPSFPTVYLSAGPREGEAGCRPGETRTCAVWRLDDVLEAPRATELVPRAPGAWSAVQAVASPDGAQLAWIEQARGDDVLWVGDPQGEAIPVAEGRVEWPAFLGEDALLFDAVTGRDGDTPLKTVYEADPHAGVVAAATGAAAGGASAHDPAWDPRHHRLATFGPRSTAPGAPFDLLVQAQLDAGWSTPAPFDGGGLPDGQAVREVHHPAWVGGEGSTLVGVVHAPVEVQEGRPVRRLHAWEERDGAWAPVGPAFPWHPGGLDPAVHLPPAAAGVLTWKYPEPCGPDHLVATLFYAAEGDAARGAEVTTARVVLVRLADGTHVDLTSTLEDATGLDRGALSGFVASCGALAAP